MSSVIYCVSHALHGLPENSGETALCVNEIMFRRVIKMCSIGRFDLN